MELRLRQRIIHSNNLHCSLAELEVPIRNCGSTRLVYGLEGECSAICPSWIDG